MPAVSPLTHSAPGDGRVPRRSRHFWLAAGAALLALAGGLVLLHRHAGLTAARAAAAAASEDPAEARLRSAVDARPNDPAARLALGRYDEDHAHPFEAMTEYAEARRLEPGDVELPLRLATVLQTGHIVGIAAAQLREALRAHPGDLKARLSLAELYLTTADPQRARAVMEAQRAAVWKDADAAIMLGRTEEACGDTAGAVAAFKHSLALQPQQAEAWYRMGRAYLAAGKTDLARDGFFHATMADRSHAEYPFYAGLSYLRQPRTASLIPAVNFLKLALSIKPNYTEADYEYAAALEREGQRQEALMRYSRAVLDDLNAPEANLALGRDLAATGKKVDADRYLGRYYDLKDRPADAAREFRAMAAAAPKSVQPALLEGQIYIRTQQNARAVAVTEAALKRHPNDPQLLERLSVLKINRGDLPYARRLLHHWLTIAPKASRPLWLLGRCDLADMKYPAAVTWLRKAVAKEPYNGNYLAFLGAALLKLNAPGSQGQADSVLAQAIVQEPDNAEYRDLYAQSLQRLGRYEAARRQYLQALDTDPYRISCYTPISELAWRLHQPGVAAFFPPVIRAVQNRLTEEVALWRQVWDHPEDADAHLKLARFLCRTADLTKAGYQLEQVLALRPGSAEARQLLATVQRAQEVL